MCLCSSFILLSDHDTGLHHAAVNLLDSIHEARVSERQVALKSDLPVLLTGGGHDLLESRVDDVDFISTLKLANLVLVSSNLEEMGISLNLILLRQTARSDVIEILKPLEVRAGNTTAVNEHVWRADDASAEEDLLSCIGGGAIGTFEDGLDLHVLSIASVQ